MTTTVPRARRRRFLACLVAVGASLGVPVAGAGSAVAADAEGAVTADAEPARVTLLSRGSAPRVALRNAFAPGTTAQGTMEMTQAITAYAEGVQAPAVDVPPVRMGLSVSVEEVRGDGSARITGSYPSVAVVDDGSVSPAQLEQLQSALDPITGVTQTYTVTSRNEVREANVAGTGALQPAVRQIVTQIVGQIGGVALVYPREAVGAGAEWRAVSNLRLSGVDLRQTTQVTLRELNGKVAVFDLDLTQVAPRQKAEFPGTPDGAEVEVTQWRFTGGGSTTIDLGDPLPRVAESSIGGTQRLRISQGGTRGSTRTDLETEIALTR